MADILLDEISQNHLKLKDPVEEQSLKKPVKVQKPTSRCYNPLFLILWILTWLTICLITGVSYKVGNYQTLLFPNDSMGNQCGIFQNSTLNLSKSPYLIFFNTSDNYQRCFERCPNPVLNPHVCRYGVTPPTNATIRKGLIDNGTCISTIKTTSGLFNS